jgi:hypothetical protein
LAQNPKGLPSSVLPKNVCFTLKTYQKSIFYLYDAHILARLDVTVFYTIFLGFEKYRASAQKLKGLAFCFTIKCLFTVKTGQKYVFHLHKVYILHQLDASVLYINVYEFWKISSFGLKHKEARLRCCTHFFEVLKNIQFRLKLKWVSLRFYKKKNDVHDGNWPKICISWTRWSSSASASH